MPAPALAPPPADIATPQPARPGTARPGTGGDGAPRPVARVRPAPQCEPDFDEQGWDVHADGAAWSGPRQARLPVGPTLQGALALAFTLPSGLPALPGARAHLRLVASAAPVEDEAGSPGTPTAALPDPAQWANRYVQATLEVLAGHRPVAQLVRWTSAAVYADVQRHALRARRTPVTAMRRAHVRSVHVNEPAEGVAEVAAVVLRSGRVRAVALRLEGIGGRWQCTALHVG